MPSVLRSDAARKFSVNTLSGLPLKEFCESKQEEIWMRFLKPCLFTGKNEPSDLIKSAPELHASITFTTRSASGVRSSTCSSEFDSPVSFGRLALKSVAQKKNSASRWKPCPVK